MRNGVADLGMASRPKKYEGEYIGTVKVVDRDPKKGMRIKVEVEPLFSGCSEDSLPWATYKLPFGFRSNDGFFIPVQVGDRVWVDFPFDGDTRRPRITGSVHEFPDEKPVMPDDAWGGDDKEDEDAEYHKDVVFKQHDGIIKLRENGEILVQQLSSGTNVRIETDGTISITTSKKQEEEGDKVEKSILVEVADPDGVLCYRAKKIYMYADEFGGGLYDDCPKEMRASTKKKKD